MPRKRAADRVGPVKTRSRAGCSECRASRVRCDTKKPACTRCQDKGLVCSTRLTLKWESEFSSRGLAFGRAGVWSKSKDGGNSKPKTPSQASASFTSEHEWCLTPRIEPWAFVNSVVDTFERPDYVTVAFNELSIDEGPSRVEDGARANELVKASSRFMVSMGPKKCLPLFPQLSKSAHGHLFQYYLQEVCPRTTASSRMQSPFATVILPFCLTASPTLFKAIQALGACYWSRFNSSISVSALRFKSEALRGLRGRLMAAESPSCLLHPEILVTMMMLCLYELVDSCDERWTIHLKGAGNLIRFKQQKAILSTYPTDPVTSFAEHFFAFHDVMGRTACGEKALFGEEYWRRDDHDISPWMGCSPELVSILLSITELSRKRRQIVSDSARAMFSLQTATLKRQLEELVQNIDEEDVNLRATAELKRLSALLYLHCALSNASPSTTLVIGYVRKILSLISDLLQFGSPVTLAWPLFVAAVELNPLQDEQWTAADGTTVYGRPLVLRALAAMSESSVTSIARTRAVIIKVWQARDDDMLKGVSRDIVDDPTLCNDWEQYIAPVSMAMSLA